MFKGLKQTKQRILRNFMASIGIYKSDHETRARPDAGSKWLLSLIVPFFFGVIGCIPLPAVIVEGIIEGMKADPPQFILR